MNEAVKKNKTEWFDVYKVIVKAKSDRLPVEIRNAMSLAPQTVKSTGLIQSYL